MQHWQCLTLFLVSASQMISAEAPVLFAKAAEIFITEISLRAWIHTEDNKRRTLQRNDIAMAISKYDQFDFLIDIVPREELKAPPKRSSGSQAGLALADATAAAVPSDQVQYFLQQAGLQTAHAAGQQIQILQTGNGLSAPTGFSLTQPLLQVQVPTTEGSSQAQQVILAGQATQAGQAAAGQTLQIMHPMNGDVSQIPISLNSQQLQMIRMQLQGQTALSGQPILIQASPQAGAAQYQIAAGQSGQQFILTSGAGAQTLNTQDSQSDHLEETE